MSDKDPMEKVVYWAGRLADRSQTLQREAEDDELERWLEEDPLNAQALKEVVETWEVVDNLAAHPEMEAVREAALANAASSSSRPIWPVSWTWQRIAASIALLIAVGGGALWYALAPTTYATMMGERRVVTLADGSRVSLDAETTVKTSYDRGRRMFWLARGRAKFSVAKDPLRPFTVTAGNKIVVATGTEFSVERLPNQVRIILYEGSINLLEATDRCTCDVPIKPGSKVAAAKYLSPSREIVLADGPSPRGRTVDVDAVDPERSRLWESGILAFKDESLSQVVYRFNRYARKPLVIADAQTSRLRISGTFDSGDTNGLVEGLEAAFNVRSSESEGSIKLFQSTAEPKGSTRTPGGVS